MKARPRSVENRIAGALNDHFTLLGMTRVERIPVLGRTGPDISTNEMKLVVDVKSRREIPKTIFFPLMIPFTFDHLMAVRLCNLNILWDEDAFDCPTAPLDFSSKLIRGYLEHMEEWTAANEPDGISAVILHRPETPIGNSVVVIHSISRRRLYDCTNKYRYHQFSAE